MGLKFLSRVASVAVMSTGGLVLIGWLLDIAPLKSVWPGLVAMKANAALAFVFEGCALWMLGQTRRIRSLAGGAASARCSPASLS